MDEKMGNMYAIEFQAQVKDGVIEVPEQYQEYLKTTVRVILLVNAPAPSDTFIDQLLVKPLQVPGFRPMSRDEIYGQ